MEYPNNGTTCVLLCRRLQREQHIGPVSARRPLNRYFREIFRDVRKAVPKNTKLNKNVEIRATKDALIVFLDVLSDKEQPIGYE